MRQLFDEYVSDQAAPGRPPDFVSDPLRVAAVAEAMRAHQVINLCGLSGSGKTYAAIEYVNAHSAAYAAVLWLNGIDLEGVTDLRAVPIQRLGVRLNLAYQLKDHPCFLVIDSYEQEFASLATLLNGKLHSETRVLITSQQRAPNFPNCELPELSDQAVTSLLLIGPRPPSSNEIAQIIETAGRHPLVLAMLRDLVRETPHITWPILIEDIRDNLGVRMPRFDGHELGPKKGLNDDKEEGSRSNAPAV